jgi:hypothetical protein
MGARVGRDRRGNIPWAEMSPLVGDIRERLGELKPHALAEFNRALEASRPELERLAQWGGDPRFVLCVLAGARWRRLRAPGEQFPRWLRVLRRLACDEELYRLLGSPGAPRARLREAVGDALVFLQSFVWQDEGIFESRTTRRHRVGPRGESRQVDRAAAVLSWHLKIGTTGRWDRVGMVTNFLLAFELIKASARDPLPIERVKKRLQRLDDSYFDKFVIPGEQVFFHELHIHLSEDAEPSKALRCGTACPIPA